MSRARLLTIRHSDTARGMVATCVLLFAAPSVCIAQTNLPLGRINATSTDCYAEGGLNVYINRTNPFGFWWDGDWNEDYDQNEASFFTLAASMADPSDANQYGTGHIWEVMGWILNPNPGNSYHYGGCSAYMGYDAIAHTVPSGGSTYWSIKVPFLADARAGCDLQIQAHPSNPSLGTATNSATMRPYIYLRSVTYTMDGPALMVLGPTQYYTSVNNSELTATTSDPYNELWTVEGTLQQGTSSNPSASPLTIDDTYYYGLGAVYYYPTEATQVGATISTYSSVFIDYHAAYGLSLNYEPSAELNIDDQAAVIASVTVP